ncbi:hypothetical protein DRQ15_11730 [candidate division KSB1 bacterium]|nr:MAG: hypothetical protein DRQ15_11730 [candidate division KSB1 bacterium]
MQEIAITGCAGFPGSQLVDALLEKDYRVIGIDHYLCPLKKSKKFRFIVDLYRL